MSVVVKSQAKATIEFRLMFEGKMESIMVQPGRNIMTEDTYDKIKDHAGFKRNVNNDLITINTEGAVAKKAAAEPDFAYVEALAGNEDGKDVIKEYALAWDIKLNKKNTVENMIATFKDEYEGK